LIDVGKRKFPGWSDDRIGFAIKALTGVPNIFLPKASSSHTRSFLNSNEEDSTRKQKIFDAFITLDPNSTIYLGFNSTEEPSSVDDLDSLLHSLDYLGRSESWVEARLVNEEVTREIVWNCLPAENGTSSGSRHEVTRVACVLPQEEYNTLSQKPESTSWHGKSETFCSWYESLCLTSEDLRQQGWSAPPVLMWATYGRTRLASTAGSPKKTRLRKNFNWARFELTSTVLPRIEETLPIAERVRSHLMGINKRLNGGDEEAVSSLFSGKNPGGIPLDGHCHAFYLPVDEDGDGWIDHLIVKSMEPFTEDEIFSLDRLRSVWQRGGKPDIQFTLVELAKTDGSTGSRRWASATPFVTKRHYRKGRGTLNQWLEEEVKRECSFLNLPLPSRIDVIEKTVHTMQPMPWWAFVRNRKGCQPMRGFGFVLEFKEEVKGPFALGTLCHFGLGSFLPVNEYKRGPDVDP